MKFRCKAVSTFLYSRFSVERFLASHEIYFKSKSCRSVLAKYTRGNINLLILSKELL